MRRQSERNFIAVNYMQQRVMPMTERISGADLRGYYESHPEDFTVPDGVAWKHIFIAAAAFKSRDDARRLAESLHARLRAGEDFKVLSKQYCHGDSALRDGDGLGRKRGEIKPPELESPLFKAAAGELLPVMELRNGYHVARVESREFAGLKPFDEKVQKQIRSRLREEIAQREMKRLVSELKRVAVIEYPGQ
jgi:parvulin-like peptidyl-prolyl isomerase